MEERNRDDVKESATNEGLGGGEGILPSLMGTLA